MNSSCLVITIFLLIINICSFGCTNLDGNKIEHNFDNKHNPTAVIPAYPGPDPGYVIAASSAGLSNRLRVLASFLWVTENSFDGAHLVFVWDVNEACPGHFLELFEPIDNVIFATSESAISLYKDAFVVDNSSTQTMRAILLDFNVTVSHTAIQKHMYSKLLPNKQIMYKATKFIDAHNI